MKIVNQNIPAELYNAYTRSLRPSTLWKGKDTPVFGVPKFGVLPFGVNTKILTTRSRQLFRLPHMKSSSLHTPSVKQLKVRSAFKKCVDCFNGSPSTGGVEPPEIGYRSREWWYNQANGATWPDYIGEDKKSWDGAVADPLQYEDIDGNLHDANWFLKTDEQDFIDFYDEMKTKYGYPWSAKNDPDQIVTKMNQIVCDEIEYDEFGDISIFYTPGQTAKTRRGVCDDQSALHYALTWRALKDLSWTDDQINNKLGCVIAKRFDNRHMYNWWKSTNGATKIVENTYDPGESPRVMGGMKYWGDEKAGNLVQRFNKAGHYEPSFVGNGKIYPLWYFNYFMSQTWWYFYADTIPDWCGLCIPLDHVKDSYYKEDESDWIYGWDAAWDVIWDLYLAASWISYSTELQYLIPNGTAYQSGNGKFMGSVSCDKATLVFKPCEHMSESMWLNVETIKIQFKTQFYGTPYATCRIRCIETGEVQTQDSGQTIFYIPHEHWHYDEMTLTFETYAENKLDLRPPWPWPYNVSSTGYQNHIIDAALYCVGKGIY